MKLILLFIGLVIVGYLLYIFFFQKEEETIKKAPTKKKQESYGDECVTHNGIKVRSKAEKIVGDFLTSKGYHWEYEKEFAINGVKKSNPDFFIKELNCYLEYFGMMKDRKYKETAIFKMNQFRKFGIKCIDLYPEDITARTTTGKSFYSEDKLRQNWARYVKRKDERRQFYMHTKKIIINKQTGNDICNLKFF